MTRHTNPARLGLTPHAPREQAPGSSLPNSAAPPEGMVEPGAASLNAGFALPRTVEDRLATLNRRCEQASWLLILFAALWFLTPCIGAWLP